MHTRNLSGLTALALLFSLASGPALASVEDEAELAERTLLETVLALDDVGDAAARETLLKKAIEAIEIATSLSAGNPELEDTVVRGIREQGLSADQLRLSLVESLAGRLKTAADATIVDGEAKAVLLKISDPAYLVAGWNALARADLAAKQPEEAERLVARAIEDARRIERPETRDGALRASILTILDGAMRPPIVSAATDAMVSADARSEIYQRVARAALEAQGLSRGNDDLAGAAETRMAAGDPRGAMLAAQAMDRDDDRRTRLLEGIVSSGVEALDDALAMEAAKSLARNKDQDAAIRRIVDNHIARNRPLRALDFVQTMLSATKRTDAGIEVADALASAGYRQAAIDLLNKADAADAGAAAKIAATLARLGSFADAERIAKALPSGEARSFAFSRLAKQLADADRTGDAERAANEAASPADVSHARTGIARALARAGRIAEAEELARSLSDDGERARVDEALAVAEIKAGRLAEANRIIGAIGDPGAKSRALVSLAAAVGESDRPAALSALRTAMAGLSDHDSADELAEIAMAFAKLGEQSQCAMAIKAIKDPKIRDKAQESVARILVDRGDLEGARALSTEAASPAARDAILAEAASGAFRRSGDVERLVGDLSALPYQVRVKHLRAMAEIRVRGLDASGWLGGTPVRQPGKAPVSLRTIKANFSFGDHVVQAPAAAPMTTSGVRIPEIFAATAETMRAKTPAPSEGVAHVAVLGFSPFSLEAFKLTSTGNAAVHRVQVSQQLTWPNYIAVESGVVTLGQLLRSLPKAVDKGFLSAAGDSLTVRAPIIVLPGATLLISGQEFGEYRLSATTGAFIAVAGTLRVQDASVVGFDEVANRPAVADDAQRADFRPFITGWGGSDLQIAGSRLAMLGYASSKAFGLTQSSGAAVQSLYSFGTPSPKGQIVDNSFENLRYGYYSYETADIRLVGNEYRDNIVYGIDPHDRSHNLLIALNTAYGTHKKHGIIVSREVDDSFIVGNVSLNNHGSGLMLDRMSRRNVIYANTAINNEGDGLTFYESGCNIAAANHLAGNARAGVKVRNSVHVGLFDNLIARNEGIGADIYVADLKNTADGRFRNFVMDPYAPISTTSMDRNDFVANGTAINAVGAAQIVLDRNRFTDQKNRVFAGDLRQLSSYLLQIGDGSSVSVEQASCPARSIAESCAFNTAGDNGDKALRVTAEPTCKPTSNPPLKAAGLEKTNG